MTYDRSTTTRWMAAVLFASIAGCQSEAPPAAPVASQSDAKSADCAHSLARDADDWIWSDRGERFAAYPKRGAASEEPAQVPECVRRLQALLANDRFNRREDPNSYVLVCVQAVEPDEPSQLFYHSMEIQRPSRPYLDTAETGLQRFTTMRILNVGTLPVWVRSNVGYAPSVPPAVDSASLPVRWQNGRKVLRVRDTSESSTQWTADAGIEVAGRPDGQDAANLIGSDPGSHAAAIDVELRETSFPTSEEYDHYATILELAATPEFAPSGGILIRSQSLIL
jgi:hypothetical protein